MSRYRLSLVEGRYCLIDSFSPQKPLSLSFFSPKFLHRVKAASKNSELLARAVGTCQGLKVVDCTAGLGREGGAWGLSEFTTTINVKEVFS